jgi:hypothetical protein
VGKVRGVLAGTKTVRGGVQWVELCRLDMNETGDQFTGTILTTATAITQPTGAGFPVPNPRIVVRARVGAGNRGGGAGVVQSYTLAGNPLPFSGTSVYVEALICPNETANFNVGANATNAPLPETVTALVTGIISLGGSAEIQPTQWVQPKMPLQLSEQVMTTPCRLRQVQGWNAGAALAYLMFFDTANGSVSVVPGTIPLFTIPVGGLPTPPAGPVVFSNDFITSARIFQYGLYWAISTTPDSFTADAADNFRVDIELFAQQETLNLGGSPL